MVVRPEMDFETYSEAGYEWNGQKWQKLSGANKYGIQAVGSTVYTQHPTCEVLMLAYDLKDGKGVRQWLAGMPYPVDLFTHFANGGVVEAVNDKFEWEVWTNVCVPKLGWPPIKRNQLYDTQAKALAWGLPRSLADIARVTNANVQKQPEGKRLINKFSCPKQPSKKDPSTRIYPHNDPTDYALYMDYNIADVRSESACTILIPDIEGEELEFQQLTQEMNARGMAIDMPSVEACIKTLEAEYEKAGIKLAEITNGAVTKPTQNAAAIKWLASVGVRTKSLDATHREELLARPWPPGSKAHEFLKLWELVTGAGPRKVFTMKRMADNRQRLCNLYVYHGARTGRDSGVDVQPQNLVKAGHKWFDGSKWDWKYAEECLQIIREGRAAELFESPVLAVSGCIRSLFVAAPGHDLICSDYNSIEAVVTACLAGEQWRIDAFNKGEDIYLTSCAKAKGRTLEWYMQNGGKKHPDRQDFGKPMELGCGFGGWIGALFQFGFEGSEEEAKKLVLAWRAANPMIVEFWGGQCRGKPWAPTHWERFGLEGAAINAIQYPGRRFKVTQFPGQRCERICDVEYYVHNDVLYCVLPSGRHIAYHKPRLSPSDRWDGHLSISFEGWNSDPKKGPKGWIRMGLYGSLLCENTVQASARDVLRRGIINLEKAGYPIVLRVHDEPAAEVPEGYGSVEEFERLMAGNMPDWCSDWPIRASGGWRGKRYRKD